MTLFQKKFLAVAAALVAVAAAGCGGGGSGGGKPQGQEAGNAKVGVSLQATQADINHITLTVAQGAVSGSNPAMADITYELTKVVVSGTSAPGNQWTGAISNIPAGSARVFRAQAYRAAGSAAADLVYSGETVVAIVAGGTATVTLLLQEQNVTPGPTRYAPQITALTLSNSYVLPNSTVSIHAAAISPDGLGGALSYQWSSICDAGTGSFSPPSGTGAGLDTVFLAPNRNATCQLALLVKEAASASNHNTPLSVTTYVTVVVNGNFGKGNVQAFPNSFPLVTVLGDFRYNYFSDVTIMPVGQQADFQFSATDPDGDNVRYNLTAKCGASLTAAAAAPDLSSDYFWYLRGGTYVGHASGTDGTAFTTTGSTGVTPPSAYTSEWKPHFGGATDGFNYSTASDDCVFTVTVHDLCTAGNCGAVADGSDKTTTIAGVPLTSSTTGVINATHPARPARAPVVEAVATVNQDGPDANPPATWDPQKIAFIDVNQTYSLAASADDRWESVATAPTVAWSCNTGTLSAPSNVAGTYAFGAGVANLASSVRLTTGASVPPNAACTATFTGSAGLSTVVTFRFLKKDPCAINNWADGHACSSGNLCLAGETCQGFVCQGGAAITCSVSDAQCQTAVCDPATGCGATNRSNGTLCNADSNGCTGNDACVSGACQAGAAVTCNTPADAQCQSANGTCASTGNNSHACSYVNLADGTLCNADSNGCTQDDACAAGACHAGAAVTCAQGGNPCQAATGTCNSTGSNNHTCAFANAANGTACNVAGTCVANQTCNAGACQGGTPACPTGQGCTPTTPNPTCVASGFSAQVARDVWVSPPGGLGMDAAGAAYVAGGFALNTPTDFGGVTLQSTGGVDIVVAKYDTTGHVAWARVIGDDGGDPTDQTASGAAVNNTGRVGIIGKIAGAVTFGSSPAINSANGVSFIGALSGADGSRLWANGYNLGSNGVFARIASNPASSTGRFAVCGQANRAAADLVPGATYGGLQDAVIAVFDNAGARLWSAQLGSAGNDACSAIAMDDNGDVFAAGQFDGAALTLGTFTLTGPGTTARKFLWVAKFNGSTGAVTAAVAYNGPSGGILPQVASTNALGDLFLAGNFSGAPVFGTSTLASAGADDAFVLKLDHTTLVPVIAPVRIGGTGSDTIKGLGVTSYGDVLLTGTISPSGGAATTGFAALTVNGNSSPDQLVAKLNGTTLATDFAALYGDAGTQNGDSLVVNRFSTGAARDAIAVGGTLTGSANYGGAAGTLTAGNAIDVSLVLGRLQ